MSSRDKERLIAAGMLTGAQIAAKLGVRRTTIGRWRRQGRLTARICNEMGGGGNSDPKIGIVAHDIRTTELRRIDVGNFTDPTNECIGVLVRGRDIVLIDTLQTKADIPLVVDYITLACDSSPVQPDVRRTHLWQRRRAMWAPSRSRRAASRGSGSD